MATNRNESAVDEDQDSTGTDEIHIEYWTLLHSLDAAHVALMGFFPKQTVCIN